MLWTNATISFSNISDLKKYFNIWKHLQHLFYIEDWTKESLKKIGHHDNGGCWKLENKLNPPTNMSSNIVQVPHEIVRKLWKFKLARKSMHEHQNLVQLSPQRLKITSAASAKRFSHQPEHCNRMHCNPLKIEHLSNKIRKLFQMKEKRE